MARDMYKRRRYCRFSAEGIKLKLIIKMSDILKDFITENGKLNTGKNNWHKSLDTKGN